MSRFPFALTLLLVGCSQQAETPPPSQPARAAVQPRRQTVTESLQAQADEYVQAMLHEDANKIIEFLPAKVLERLGGRERAKQLLANIAGQSKGQKAKVVSIDLGQPSTIIENAGESYAVIPFTMEAEGPAGSRQKRTSYLIAVSDNGKRWKFIDGTGIGSNREMVKALFPDFPKRLALPEG
jgi:hypothetical protein